MYLLRIGMYLVYLDTEEGAVADAVVSWELGHCSEGLT